MKMTNEGFREKAKRVHGGKYLYDKTDVDNRGDDGKVVITCPVHGDFRQTPKNHLSGHGCHECAKRKSMSTEELIEKAKKSHTSKFDSLDYSKTKMVSYGEKVTVTCTVHGDFEISPEKLIKGHGCPKCRYLKSADSKRTDSDKVIEKLRYLHPEYDYSKSWGTCKGMSGWLTVTCHKKDKDGVEHGDFYMKPSNEVNPYLYSGCPKCARENATEAKTMSSKTFFAKCTFVHNGFYDYSQTEYKGSDEFIEPICPLHGKFRQIARNHAFGQGCPVCSQSKLENEMYSFLSDNSVKFEREYSPSWLNSQRLDFYLPEYNVAIECQGKQHFLEDAGWKESLETLQLRDERKASLCNENGVRLYYYSNLGIDYPYKVYEDKDAMLSDIKKIGEP